MSSCFFWSVDISHHVLKLYMYYIKKTTDNILDNIPETPGGVLMNFPLK